MRVAEVLVEGGEALGEVLEHLAVPAVDVALVAVVVPAAVVGLGDFEADVGLDDLGDGAELVAQPAAGVVGVAGGGLGGLQGLDALDGVGAGLGDDVAGLVAGERRFWRVVHRRWGGRRAASRAPCSPRRGRSG